MIDTELNKFRDLHTGALFSIKDALDPPQSHLGTRRKEIFDCSRQKRVTIPDAIKLEILDPINGTFYDNQKCETLSLQKAYEKSYIEGPMTLLEAVQKGLVDNIGLIKDPVSKKRVTVVEAIAEGLLDPDIKHIVDATKNEIVSISDALKSGILDLRGKYCLLPSKTTYTISEAVKHGWVVDGARHSIFDLKGIYDALSETVVTFNEAVDREIVLTSEGVIIDQTTGKRIPFKDAVKEDMVDAVLHQMLMSPSGLMSEDNTELSLLAAVQKGRLDPRKGMVRDKSKSYYGGELPPLEAYKSGWLRLNCAMHLSSLLDMNPSIIFADSKIKIESPNRPSDKVFHATPAVSVPHVANNIPQINIRPATQTEESLIPHSVNEEQLWLLPNVPTSPSPDNATITSTETGSACMLEVHEELSISTPRRESTRVTKAVVKAVQKQSCKDFSVQLPKG